MSKPVSRAAALAVLRERFGHDDFQPGQWDSIRPLLAGEDSLVVMPTGSGKSLIYQLPALMLSGLTVVVSPLIALMKDQQDKLVAQGMSNREIASELYISENTVKNHVRNILEKLHLHSRMEAVVYAVREKLLDIR